MEELHALLSRLERDAGRTGPEDIAGRLEALERIDALLPYLDGTGTALRQRALAACERLEALNAAFFEELRGDIRNGRGAQRLLACIAGCGRRAPAGHDAQGYDLLDDLVGGVLRIGEPALPTVELPADMVFYQPTPARHILAMLRHAAPGPGDVLVDLGSGLGHVPLLAAICTRAQAIGIELEPAYVACAQAAADALELDNVRFIQGDARGADFSTGTVFYLYTPFKGGILREVLDRLRGEAARRRIRVCTFGPCTAVVAQQPWLRRREDAGNQDVATFDSGDVDVDVTAR